MKRIALFVATNVAVLAVIYLVLNILGVEQLVTQDGTQLDLRALEEGMYFVEVVTPEGRHTVRVVRMC